MKTITTVDTFGKEQTYEVVKKIPLRFCVWNIGKNMGNDEYIPLCEKIRPGDPECYEININTVKAIKLPAEEVKLLNAAASWGVNSLKTAEKALKSKREGYTSNKKRYHAKKTIEIFKRISE